MSRPAEFEEMRARIETLEACLRCDDESVRTAWAREAEWKAGLSKATAALAEIETCAYVSHDGWWSGGRNPILVARQTLADLAELLAAGEP